MKRFDFTPTYGTSVQVERKTQTAEFGDGYKQTADDGLNARRRAWNVGFTDIKSEKAAAIRAFLDSVGAQPFLWKPPAPDDRTIMVYVADGQYSHEKVKYDDETIGATFVECFNTTTDRCADVTIGGSGGTRTLACATAGTTIYYTKTPSEGVEPTESSTAYTGAFAVSSGDVIKAIATHPTKMTSATTTFLIP